MQCGHCGTPINEGYTTCPACGAVYRRRPGVLATLPQTCGLLAIVMALLTLDKESGSTLLLAGIVLVVVSRIAIWMTPYRWWRREP